MGVTAQLVVPCYLIRHDKQYILWDSGIGDQFAGPACPGYPTLDLGCLSNSSILKFLDAVYQLHASARFFIRGSSPSSPLRLCATSALVSKQLKDRIMAVMDYVKSEPVVRIIIAATVSLFSSPAFPQQPNQGAASIPDLSGIWSHPFVWGFEPPPSGPGPVVNKSRQRQIFDADGRPLRSANAPLVGDPFRLIGDYTNPILKPEAAEVVKKLGEITLTGVSYPTPANQCWPGGVPFIFIALGMQLLQQPDKITILYPFNEFRQVRMNQPHPAQVTPSWYGDSVGHYEGDTLVIDTVGIKIGPFAMVDMFGTPHTEALHVVERYRLIDYAAAKEAWNRNENFRIPGNDGGPEVDPANLGKGLQLQFMVDDEGVFTMPWSATVTYRRGLNEHVEYICAENLHEYHEGKDRAVPRADKPDF